MNARTQQQVTHDNHFKVVFVSQAHTLLLPNHNPLPPSPSLSLSNYTGTETSVVYMRKNRAPAPCASSHGNTPKTLDRMIKPHSTHFPFPLGKMKLYKLHARFTASADRPQIPLSSTNQNHEGPRPSLPTPLPISYT